MSRHQIPQKWFSIPASARYTGFTEPTIRKAMKSGDLRFRQVIINSNGRQINVRIRRENLDAWIEGREQPPDDPVPESHREEMIMVPVGRRAVFIQEADYLAIVNASKLVKPKDAANDLLSWIAEGTADDPQSLIHLAEELAKIQSERSN